MTTGDLILDRRPFSYYRKTWSGSDYSEIPVPDVFGRYWQKVERASEVPVGKPRLGYTYTPTWEKRRRPRRSTIEDHPYTMTLQFYTDQNQRVMDEYDLYPPHAFLGRVTYNDRFAQGYGTGQEGPVLWGANDVIALQGKLREKIVGSDFDMGVFLGEGREALALISEAAHRIYGAYSSFRRCDAAGVARNLGLSPARVRKIIAKNRGASPSALGSAANAWLELQYGWIPLVKDVHGAAEALAQQLNEPAVQVYRVRRKRDRTPRGSGGNPGIKTWDETCFTKAQLIARLREVDVPALNGLADPSSVAWELTPWSFVADWIIPVGSYLSARGLAQAVEGTFVTTVMHVSSWATNSGVSSNAYSVAVTQYLYRELNIRLTRTVSSFLDTPKPSIKPLGQIASWKHAANAVALVTGLFSGNQSELDPKWGQKPYKRKRS